MYEKPTAPRPIGGVIDDAIKLYRASFRTCVPIALISSLITGSVSFYVLSSFPALTSIRDPAQIWDMLKPSPLWTLFLLPGIASLLLLGAIMACQNALAAGMGLLTVVRALVVALGRLHWLLLAVVLWVLFICTAVGIALIPISPASRVLGVLAWIVLAIYLWGRFQLWMVALFAEDVGTFRALGVSWGLIEGHWWRAAMILTVGIIIVLVVSLVFGFVAGLVFVVYRVDPISLLLGNQVITAVERVFVTPMIPAVLVAMYYDFKLRREGGDLAARTKSLQST
ncbi:MAG TPA: hypothetical protein VHN17_03545 [Steroidobacteraceae bacterium]|jgi:hypothetical protein|nr:hypothetical protein [Steroidobacteraceae bacterium]